MAVARHARWGGSEAAARYLATARPDCLANPGSILRMAAGSQFYPVEPGHYSAPDEALEPWAVHASDPLPVFAAPEPQPPAAGCAAALWLEQEQKKKGGGANNADLIKMHLEDLRDTDAKLVFIVRGINAMHNKSHDLLTAHYAKYGRVVRVMVTKSTVKVSSAPGQMRMRPGSLGFIEMGSAQSVENILAAGSEQYVAGYRLRVEPFRHLSKRPTDGGYESNISVTSSSGLHSSAPSPNDAKFNRGWLRGDRSEDGSASSRERPAMVAGGAAAPAADGPAAMPLVQMASALAEASAAFLPQALAASNWQLPPREPAPPFQHQPPQPPAVASAGNAAMGALTGSSLVAALNKIVQLIGHTRALATSSTQHFAEAIVLSRMAQQQLQVLIGQCQQQIFGLSPEAANKLSRSMEERYCQMSEVLTQGAQWWAPSAAAGGSILSSAAAAAAAMAAPPPGLSQFAPAARVAPAAAAPEWGQPWPDTAEAAAELLQQVSGTAAATASVAPPSRGFAPERLDAVPPSEGAPAPQLAKAQAPHAAQPVPQRSAAGAEAPPVGAAAQPTSRSSAKNQAWLGKTSPLAMHLQELQDENPRCVFITRKIGVMGYQSQDILRMHYSQYGKVDRVLLVVSKVKTFRAVGCEKRARPGSLGFIVMATPESVEQILALGKEQKVGNCCIVVEPFERTALLHKSRAASATDSTSAGDTQGSGFNSEQGSGLSGLGSSERSEGSDKSGKGSREESEGRESSENPKDVNGAEGGSTDSQAAEADGSESVTGTNGEANEQDQQEREEAQREREEP